MCLVRLVQKQIVKVYASIINTKSKNNNVIEVRFINKNYSNFDVYLIQENWKCRIYINLTF